jgi:hypothetical protein
MGREPRGRGTPRGGRSGGRGGRGNTRRQSNKNNNKSQQKEMKFAPHLPGKPQQVTYASVKDAVIQHVQKTLPRGQDIVKSLEDMKVFDLTPHAPTLKQTALSGKAGETEQNAFNIEYQERLRQFMDREQKLEENLVKTYSLIYSQYCTRAMQSRIESHPEFETKIRHNPIELLEAIKTLMHDTVRSQYPYVSMTDALVRLVTVKQHDHESLMDYVKRFKQLRDVAVSHLGTEFLDKFVSQQSFYLEAKPSDRSKIEDEAYEQFMAYLLIRGADPNKYGSMQKNLASQFSLGNDQYPKTIVLATDALSQHRIDPKFYEIQKKNRENQKSQRQSSGTDNTNSETSFAQKSNAICHICGEKGHVKPDCKKKDIIPKVDWYITKLNNPVNAMQGPTTEPTPSNDERSTAPASIRRSGNASVASTNEYDRTEWNNFIVPTAAKAVTYNPEEDTCMDAAMNCKQVNDRFDYLKDVIILDTGSTIGGTFMNPALVQNISTAKEPLGMKTNAGTKTMTLQGEVPGYDKVWYDPTQMANIFGFASLKDKHRITYDSAREDAFHVHSANGTIKFNRTPEGLYAYKPSDNYLKKIAATKSNGNDANLLSTVKENREGYTQRQFERAKEARKLYRIMGCATIQDFKNILRQNVIQNCPITTEDVKIAEAIFGPDIGTIKGKKTRPKPPQVRPNIVEIPKELIEQHSDLTLCIDLLFVNGMPMFTSIDKTIKFRSLVPMENQTGKELYRAIDVVLRHYNKAGFCITVIDCDGQFKPIMDPVSDELEADMNYTATDEHVPEAERNNRTIGERIRAAYHNLPYRAIPKVMLRHLAMSCAKQLNLYPVRGGVSPYYSPHVILGGRNLDYNKHCKVAFGAYVQAYVENNPKNTPAARTYDAIYLRPLPNEQGGHQVMSLSTGLARTTMKVWELPITDLVIKTVEEMAEAQGIKSLKLTGRNKRLLHPADWIAGVDYENQNNEEEEEEVDEDYDELEEDQYDPIDQQEIDELLADNNAPPRAPEEDANPIIEDAAEPEPEAQDEPEEANAVSDDEPPEAAAEEETVQETGRPRRNVGPPERFVPGLIQRQSRLEHCHNLITQVSPNPKEDVAYNPQTAMVIARTMVEINAKATAEGACYAQQYILQKGLKVFGKKGSEAATKELDQLHQRNAFTPIEIAKLSPEEKRKAMDALMFLTEKRDGTIKGRLVYNGKPTREWLSREDSASPTAAQESIMLTAVIDAYEGRDVMTADVPNAFIQTHMKEDPNKKVIMKITGVLVHLLVDMSPETYGPFVVYEKGKKVLYVQVIKALYGMLIASLLWYKKFRKDLEKIGFEFNPYDACVANRTVNDKQHTVRFHVDDVKSSHLDPQVNDEFLKWLNKMYGNYGEVKATRGKIHDYLGMTFDFSEEGKVKIDMIDYINSMVDDFPVKIEGTAPTPAAEDLFAEGSSEKLIKHDAENFHTFVAKGLFACKRARPDIHTTIAALCTRVKSPNQDDWKKLNRLLKYLNGTREDKLILSADDPHVIKWYVDSAFAVHPDFNGEPTCLGNSSLDR